MSGLKLVWPPGAAAPCALCTSLFTVYCVRRRNTVHRIPAQVDAVARYIDSKPPGTMSYDEYEIILEALSEGASGHADTTRLVAEKGALAALREAYSRQVSDSGHMRGQTTSSTCSTY